MQRGVRTFLVVLEGVKKGVVRKLYIFAAEPGDCGSPPVDTIIISNANYFLNFYIENIIKIYPHYSSLSSSFFKACREASKNKKNSPKRPFVRKLYKMAVFARAPKS